MLRFHCLNWRGPPLRTADREVVKAGGLFVTGMVFIVLIATDFLGIGADAWVAIFTLTLTASTIGLWWATHDALELSRREFIASHRPHLRVRLVRIDEPEVGHPMTVRFIVSNVGYSEAKSVTAKVNLQILKVLPDKWGLSNQPSAFLGSVNVAEALAPGQRSEVELITGTKPDADWGVRAKLVQGWVHVHGEICYRDNNGISRITAFYRFSTNDVNRFRLPEDGDIERDYEYED